MIDGLDCDFDAFLVRLVGQLADHRFGEDVTFAQPVLQGIRPESGPVIKGWKYVIMEDDRTGHDGLATQYRRYIDASFQVGEGGFSLFPIGRGRIETPRRSDIRGIGQIA